jgi:hypothetical protein
LYRKIGVVPKLVACSKQITPEKVTGVPKHVTCCKQDIAVVPKRVACSKQPLVPQKIVPKRVACSKQLIFAQNYCAETCSV